jgi:hypothetical protein
MTIEKLIAKLQNLMAKHGTEMPVYSVHSSSGACSEVEGITVGTVRGDEDMGPFDLQPGTEYLKIICDH